MKNADVKLTVTITNYNQKQYIEEAVDSILRQDIGYEYEILIGDDGSNDGSWELLQSKYGKNDNIKLFRMPRDDSKKEYPDWRHARLIWFLLSKSRGEYISVLDGDDHYCGTDGFKRKISFLDQEKNNDCVACASGMIKKRGNEEKNYELHRSLIDKKSTLYDVYFSKHRQYFHIASCVFRSSVLKYADLDTFRFDGTDQTIFYFIMHYGKLYVMPEYDFMYRVLPSSMWNGKSAAEHAIRTVITLNLDIKRYKDFHFRLIWRNRRDILYVYRNKTTIPNDMDWELWKGAVEDYNLEMVKWLMGDHAFIERKLRVEMRISVLALSVLNALDTLNHKCKLFFIRVGSKFLGRS